VWSAARSARALHPEALVAAAPARAPVCPVGNRAVLLPGAAGVAIGGRPVGATTADLPIVGHPWGAGAVDRSNGLAPARRGLRVFGPIVSVPRMTCRERIMAPCRWVCEPDPAGHFLAGHFLAGHFLAGHWLAGYRLGGAGVGGAAARTGRRT